MYQFYKLCITVLQLCITVLQTVSVYQFYKFFLDRHKPKGLLITITDFDSTNAYTVRSPETDTCRYSEFFQVSVEPTY